MLTFGEYNFYDGYLCIAEFENDYKQFWFLMFLISMGLCSIQVQDNAIDLLRNEIKEAPLP